VAGSAGLAQPAPVLVPRCTGRGSRRLGDFARDAAQQINGFIVCAGVSVICRDFKVRMGIMAHQLEQSLLFLMDPLAPLQLQQQEAFVTSAEIERIPRDGPDRPGPTCGAA